MPERDRGKKFIAYYITDPARPDYLYGATWLHHRQITLKKPH